MPRVTIRGNPIEAELIIFDKDGTLLDFQETWVGIIRELITVLGNYVPVTESLKQRIGNALGIIVDKGEIDGNGALAMGTFTECNALLAYSLYREGIRWDRAQSIVEDAGRQVFGSEVRKKYLQPARGALDLLKLLKSRGIPAAVATNDKYADAMVDIQAIGAAPYIDLVVGADSVERPKPAPDMIEHICECLRKKSGESILIGDTVMDALLGRNSGVMLTIGVTGIVPEKELAQHMDIVVSSLEEIT